MKGTTNILLFGFLILAVLSMNVVSAEFWACFDEGETIDYCSNYRPSFTCDDEGGCDNFCMSEYREEDDCYVHGNWNKCNLVTEKCSAQGVFGQQEEDENKDTKKEDKEKDNTETLENTNTNQSAKSGGILSGFSISADPVDEINGTTNKNKIFGIGFSLVTFLEIAALAGLLYFYAKKKKNKNKKKKN